VFHFLDKSNRFWFFHFFPCYLSHSEVRNWSTCWLSQYEDRGSNHANYSWRHSRHTNTEAVQWCSIIPGINPLLISSNLTLLNFSLISFQL
jgi:hypothetical protein